MSFASFYEGYDDEKRGGRSAMMKGNVTMADLTPKVWVIQRRMYSGRLKLTEDPMDYQKRVRQGK